jgi:hypothetical protein
MTLLPFNSKKINKIKLQKLQLIKKVTKNEKKFTKTAYHYAQIAYHYNGFFWVKFPIACILLNVM